MPCLMSPGETFVGHGQPWQGGLVIEVLSERCGGIRLRGGRPSSRRTRPLGIIHTVMVQYIASLQRWFILHCVFCDVLTAFYPQAHKIDWRYSIGSVNYLETSIWARQEHNGFSHRNSCFIGAVLELKPSIARVYFPPDTNCSLSTIAHYLRAKN